MAAARPTLSRTPRQAMAADSTTTPPAMAAPGHARKTWM
jgi:hypothetical protein